MEISWDGVLLKDGGNLDESRARTEANLHITFTNNVPSNEKYIVVLCQPPPVDLPIKNVFPYVNINYIAVWETHPTKFPFEPEVVLKFRPLSAVNAKTHPFWFLVYGPLVTYPVVLLDRFKNKPESFLLEEFLSSINVHKLISKLSFTLIPTKKT